MLQSHRCIFYNVGASFEESRKVFKVMESTAEWQDVFLLTKTRKIHYILIIVDNAMQEGGEKIEIIDNSEQISQKMEYNIHNYIPH